MLLKFVNRTNVVWILAEVKVRKLISSISELNDAPSTSIVFAQDELNYAIYSDAFIALFGAVVLTKIKPKPKLEFLASGIPRVVAPDKTHLKGFSLVELEDVASSERLPSVRSRDSNLRTSVLDTTLRP
jgi:hypothetical protein